MKSSWVLLDGRIHLSAYFHNYCIFESIHILMLQTGFQQALLAQSGGDPTNQIQFTTAPIRASNRVFARLELRTTAYRLLTLRHQCWVLLASVRGSIGKQLRQRRPIRACGLPQPLLVIIFLFTKFMWFYFENYFRRHPRPDGQFWYSTRVVSGSASQYRPPSSGSCSPSVQRSVSIGQRTELRTSAVGPGHKQILHGSWNRYVPGIFLLCRRAGRGSQ